MLRRSQCVLAGNIKLIEFNIMQEHVDPAEVISRDIDLLAEESITDLIAAKDLFRFQKERAGAAGRIIDLIDLSLTDRSQPGQQFGYICRRVEI